MRNEEEKEEKGMKKGTAFSIEMYFPIGYAYEAEINLLKIWLLGSIICSFSFFYHYYQAYRMLYIYEPFLNRWVLRENVLIEEFSVLSYGIFRGFFLGFLLLGVLAVFHYYSYYQGSKSIYLMKRLPDRWLCLKSCIFVPVAVGFLFLAVMALLYLFYFVFYIWFTPKGCLHLAVRGSSFFG